MAEERDIDRSEQGPDDDTQLDPDADDLDEGNDGTDDEPESTPLPVVVLTGSVEDAYRAVKSVMRVVNTKSYMPILSTVLIYPYSGGWWVAATDLDRSICEPLCPMVPLVEHPGFLVGAKGLLAALDTLRAEATDFTLEYGGDRSNPILVSGVGTRTTIKLPRQFPPDDYPKLPVVTDFDTLVTVDPTEFFLRYDRVATFCSTDKTRPALNGVLIESKVDGGQFCGTDGYRCAVEPTLGEWPCSTIIHRQSFDKLRAKEFTGRVWVSTPTDDDGKPRPFKELESPKILYWELVTGGIFTFRPIEGPYPKYRDVIPTELRPPVVVSGLKSAVDKIALYLTKNGESGLIDHMQFDESPDSPSDVILSGWCSAESRIEIQVPVAAGREHVIPARYNVKYMASILSAIGDDRPVHLQWIPGTWEYPTRGEWQDDEDAQKSGIGGRHRFVQVPDTTRPKYHTAQRTALIITPADEPERLFLIMPLRKD